MKSMERRGKIFLGILRLTTPNAKTAKNASPSAQEEFMM